MEIVLNTFVQNVLDQTAVFILSYRFVFSCNFFDILRLNMNHLKEETKHLNTNTFLFSHIIYNKNLIINNNFFNIIVSKINKD